MDTAILEISWHGLLIAFVPTAIVIGIMAAWRSVVGTALYATARMLVQLLLIGYVLIYIFETDNWLVIAGVLVVAYAYSGPAVDKVVRRTLRATEGDFTGNGYFRATTDGTAVNSEGANKLTNANLNQIRNVTLRVVRAY